MNNILKSRFNQLNIHPLPRYSDRVFRGNEEFAGRFLLEGGSDPFPSPSKSARPEGEPPSARGREGTGCSGLTLSWFPDASAHGLIDSCFHLTRLGGAFIIRNASLLGHDDSCVTRTTTARNRCTEYSRMCQQLRCVSAARVLTGRERKNRGRESVCFHEACFHAKVSIRLPFVVWCKQDSHRLKNNVKSSEGRESRILTWAHK